MRRRPIRFSLICLVAGAMINVAVAWGLAARVTIDPPRWNAPLATVAGGQNYVFQLWQQGIALTDSEIVRFLVSTRLWPDEKLDDRLRFFARAPSAFSTFSGRGALYLETWRTINPEAERIKSVARLQIIESGWPCRAMRGYSWLLQSNEPSAEATEFHHRGVISLAGVVPRGWAPADTGHAAKLPLLPLRPCGSASS